MGNLLLSFPRLRAADFEPWVNASEAANAGKSVAEHAQAQSALWKKGLKQWGQTGKRIKKLRDNVDMAIYTPGSSAGLPVSVLESFTAPPAALLEDRDLYRERVQATATSILALLGVNADPVTSREHILVANVLDHHWREGNSLNVQSLIAEIQNPPMTRIGVMELDQIYPAKDRFTLAMQLNNLLAAPGFEAWMTGTPLDAGKLLYTDTGKPRISVMSIAHLADAERMFFVCMLLNELISWMRAQPGTSSLRAILYMDEIFGYLPPVANPPSKHLFLTLLKQARAYGLGLVLSTQNPVDLDYKALSNTGTWMIGRLQTERDKARVMEGLEGAAAGAEFSRSDMEQTLAGLGKRKFLLHNVHEAEPVVFNTRWAMSYLPGPLTRDQIRQLMAERKSSSPKKSAANVKAPKAAVAAVSSRPRPPSGVKQFWLPISQDAAGPDKSIVYYPHVLGAAELVYSSARYKVESKRECLAMVEPDDGPVPVDWDDCELVDCAVDRLADQPATEECEYGEIAAGLAVAKNFSKWEKGYKRWLRNEQTLTLYKSTVLKLTSQASESEADFRIRLQQVASEKRDKAVAKLKTRYGSKTTTLENRLLRANQAIDRETQQSRKKKLDTAISFGTAILGAVLGRRKISATSAGRLGTAVRSAGGISKEAGDIDRAEATAAKVQAELDELAKRFDEDVAELEGAYDAQSDELSEIVVKPKAADIEVHFVGLGWAPFLKDSKGRLSAGWNRSG